MYITWQISIPGDTYVSKFKLLKLLRTTPKEVSHIASQWGHTVLHIKLSLIKMLLSLNELYMLAKNNPTQIHHKETKSQPFWLHNSNQFW